MERMLRWTPAAALAVSMLIFLFGPGQCSRPEGDVEEQEGVGGLQYAEVEALRRSHVELQEDLKRSLSLLHGQSEARAKAEERAVRAEKRALETDAQVQKVKQKAGPLAAAGHESRATKAIEAQSLSKMMPTRTRSRRLSSGEMTEAEALLRFGSEVLVRTRQRGSVMAKAEVSQWAAKKGCSISSLVALHELIGTAARALGEDVEQRQWESASHHRRLLSVSDSRAQSLFNRCSS